MNKITLFIMTEKGFYSLNSILKKIGNSYIDFVVVGEDKNINNDFSTQIIELCHNNNIKVYKRSDNYTVKTKYSFAISWRWLINLDSSNNTLITFHDSLLPKYRGFAPLVNQLINNETTIGVTAIISKKEYDTGDIVLQSKKTILYPLKIAKAITIVSEIYADLTVRLLKKIIQNSTLQSFPQNDQNATYSLWRDEDDYKINWNDDANNICRFIDAVGTPYKGASSTVSNRLIRIHKAEVIDDLIIINRDTGKVIFLQEDKPIVVCGTGLLKIIHATYEDSKLSIFPLPKFRIRFS